MAVSAALNHEYPLKAAYLFHLAELTEWPEPGNIKICVLGDSQLRGYLPALAGQAIDDRAVQIMPDQPPGSVNCSMLFVSDNASLTPQLSEQAKNRHILLVSDAEGFAEKGGMVQLSLRDNKLKLVIYLPAVKQAGLKLSSKLLRMAEILE